MIILVVGMPGCGKNEFTKIAYEYGYQVIHMGDIVRAYTTSLGLPVENSVVGKVANEERKKHGMDIWAKRTLKYIKKRASVIDGIRNIEEVLFFQKHLKDQFLVVGIFANERVRFERIQKRGRVDDAKTYQEFKERDNRELAWGIANVFILADVILLNTSSLAVFKRRVRTLLHKLELGVTMNF